MRNIRIPQVFTLILNKASAWESRGFVIKKEGMHFDTPSFTSIYNFNKFIKLLLFLYLSSYVPLSDMQLELPRTMMTKYR